jgi:thiol-disulfide isomerase/thioredoxin
MSRLKIGIAFLVLGIFVFPLFRGYCDQTQAKPQATMNILYPGVVSELLAYAELADLPNGLVLRSDKTGITAKELEEIVNMAPKEIQGQLNRNMLFLLEQVATDRILLKLAKDKISVLQKDESVWTDADIIGQYLKDVVKNVKVSDEEIKDFYMNNQDIFGGAPFESVKDTLKEFVTGQKQQEELVQFIRNLGKTVPIQVDASWVKKQVILARDNPVDKARLSGKPSLVDFGATGCRPCDMMAPILEDLKRKYGEKINILFVHVGKEQVLAARYRIQSIPVQVFFDKDGNEIFRHTGFFPQNEIEKKFSEMGVK